MSEDMADEGRVFDIDVTGIRQLALGKTGSLRILATYEGPHGEAKLRFHLTPELTTYLMGLMEVVKENLVKLVESIPPSSSRQ